MDSQKNKSLRELYISNVKNSQPMTSEQIKEVLKNRLNKGLI